MNRTLVWVLIIIFALFAFTGLPGGYWNSSYGYVPTSLGTIIVVVLLILLLTGRI